jgi:hypothetical protein
MSEYEVDDETFVFDHVGTNERKEFCVSIKK